MATNYPTSLDTLTNPTATDDTVSVDHAAQHANVNDAVEALQTKLGTGSSTATDNTVLRGTGAGATAFGQIDVGDIASGSLSGADTTLITGTPGTNTYAAVWNADGDLVDSSGAPVTTANYDDGSVLDGDHVDIDFTPSNYTPSTTPSEAADVDDLAAHLAGIDNVVSTSREIFMPVLRHSADANTYISETGGLAYAVLSATERINFAVTIPADFNTLTSVHIVMYPDATETIQWDNDVTATAAGESISTSSTTNTQLAVTANQLTFASITAAIPTLAAGDLLAFDLASDTSDLRIVGARLIYSVI